MDQIFAVRQISKKFFPMRKMYFRRFVDFQMSNRYFVSAPLEMQRVYGVGGKLLKAVQSFYVHSKACVRV